MRYSFPTVQQTVATLKVEDKERHGVVVTDVFQPKR